MNNVNLCRRNSRFILFEKCKSYIFFHLQQLHRPDVSYSYSSGSAVGGVTSGRSSPSAGYAPSQGSKDDDIVADGSGGYHTRPESPPSKRRKRTSAPAAGHADSNTASHTTGIEVGLFMLLHNYR